ncbi:MAG: glycosyltransferase [Gemmatimonadota bacterium]
MSSPKPLFLSVIVPVHNGEATLEESLVALRGSDLDARAWELIVVDDASSDSSGEIARTHADRVVTLTEGPHGPAFARNRGAETARGDLLAFVDADVVVHGDALARLVSRLTGEPDLVAVFGAYDTEPRARGLVTEYRNLLHHHVHASRPGPANTFWAGLGAIRRDDFLRAGGFDERRYPRPRIEDIELGYRLHAAGSRIDLDPGIQGTHLKRWNLGSMIRCDLLDRGVPWMRLLLERGNAGPGTLNIESRERVLTALALAGVAALTVAIAIGSWAFAGFGVLLLLSVLVSNAPLLLWFARERGVLFAAGVLPLRLLYYGLNGISVGLALILHLGSRRKTGHRSTPASSLPPLTAREGDLSSDLASNRSAT